MALTTVKHLYFSSYHFDLATTVKLKEAMHVSCKEPVIVSYKFISLEIWSFGHFLRLKCAACFAEGRAYLKVGHLFSPGYYCFPY